MDFWNDNKWWLGGLALLTIAGGAFAGVYFTAATSIPWVVSAASKIGLDLAFLNAWSTLAASGAIAGAAAGVTAAVYSVGSILGSIVGSCINLFSSTGTPEATPSTPVLAAATNTHTKDATKSGASPMSKLGGPQAVTTEPGVSDTLTHGGQPQPAATGPKAVSFASSPVPQGTPSDDEGLEHTPTPSPAA